MCFMGPLGRPGDALGHADNLGFLVERSTEIIPYSAIQCLILKLGLHALENAVRADAPLRRIFSTRSVDKQ